MWQWMDYTPQFQLMVVLISSPLSLMVALWGMTSKKMLHMMSDGGSITSDSDKDDMALTIRGP